MFCGVGYSEEIRNNNHWQCFMCTGKPVRILKRRDDWQTKMKDIFQIGLGDTEYVSKLYLFLFVLISALFYSLLFYHIPNLHSPPLLPLLSLSLPFLLPLFLVLLFYHIKKPIYKTYTFPLLSFSSYSMSLSPSLPCKNYRL